MRQSSKLSEVPREEKLCLRAFFLAQQQIHTEADHPHRQHSQHDQQPIVPSRGVELRHPDNHPVGGVRDGGRVHLRPMRKVTPAANSRTRARFGNLPPVDCVAAAPVATPQRNHSRGSAPSSICVTAAANKASPAPTVLTGCNRGGRANQTVCPSAGTSTAPSCPRETSTHPPVADAILPAVRTISVSDFNSRPAHWPNS